MTSGGWPEGAHDLGTSPRSRSWIPSGLSLPEKGARERPLTTAWQSRAQDPTATHLDRIGAWPGSNPGDPLGGIMT